MALTPDDYRKIAAYLSGNLSEEEMSNLRKWISSSPEIEQAVAETKKIWGSSRKRYTFPNHDVDTDWNRLDRLIKSQSIEKNHSIFSVNSIMLKIAASVALVCASAYVFFLMMQPREKTFAASDHVETFWLPDSTQVWLNINSTLRYSSEYGLDSRNVALSGEGYFKVKSDKQRPFTVIAEKTSVKVLGTSFNLKESESDVRLTVAEGKVEIFETNKPSISQTVTKNETATMKEGRIVKSKSLDRNFASWRSKNNPRFENETRDFKAFLKSTYTWHKNQINQTVITGSLHNDAEVASYKEIVFTVSYKKPNGSTGQSRITIADVVPPKATIRFEKRLLDIFTDTKEVKLDLESAETVIL